MNKWSSAFDKLRERNWQEICSQFEISTPFIFDSSKYDTDVGEIVEDVSGDDFKEGSYVVELPGRDLILAQEALFYVAKFSHVLDCARKLAERGAVTWSSSDAHHASILGARAIVALFGVLPCRLGDRNVILDFRPELGRIDYRRKFRRANRDKQNPVLVLIPREKLLEQRHVWLLLNRILRVCEFSEGEMAATADSLAAIKTGSHKPNRNKLLYAPNYWTWKRDLSAPYIPKKDVESFLKGDEDDRFIDFYVCRLVNKLLLLLLKDLADNLSFDIPQTFPLLESNVDTDPILSSLH